MAACAQCYALHGGVQHRGARASQRQLARPVARVVAATTAPGDVSPLLLPLTAAELVEQAGRACRGRLDAGAARIRVDLLLPVDARAQNFMNTESLDYPASAEAVFVTACACAAALLRALGATGEPTTRRSRDSGSDPCGVVSSGGFAVVVTPSAEHLESIRKLAAEADARGTALILLNPLWNEAGQVVSDFGFGPWKAAAMSFLDTFAPAYTLQEKRIGAASTLGAGGKPAGIGGVARILRAYPGDWQVFAMGGDGSAACIRVQPDEPTYAQLNELFTKTEYSLAARRRGAVSQEGALEQAVAGTRMDWSIASAAEVAAAVRARTLSERDVDALDKSGLRSALTELNLPTAGKVNDLRARLVKGLAGQP